MLRELREMEASGIVEQSSSDWAAPIVIAPKKDGRYASVWTFDN